MILRLARRVGLHLRHRFVAGDTAIMLMGPGGERAILDTAEMAIITGDADLSGKWSNVLDDIVHESGCRIALIPDTPEQAEDPMPL